MEHSVCSLLRSSGRQTSSTQYNTFTWKMVLERPFLGDTGEDCYCTFIGDRALRLGVLVLQGLSFENFHFWEGVVVLELFF